MKKTKDLKNNHLKVRCQSHLRQAILTRSKALNVRPSEFIRFALEKAIEEIPCGELGLFLFHGKANNIPFTCERDGYVLVVLDENTAFITLPNGNREMLEDPFQKASFFHNPSQALRAFHYKVERDLLLKN